MVPIQSQQGPSVSSPSPRSRKAPLSERLQLNRLYEAIENGVADPSDSTLKDRIGGLKTEREIAQVSFDRASAELRPDALITDDKIAAFTQVMRENVCRGEIPFRRAYIRAVIDQVEVDDHEIRIHGRRSVLERLVMGGGAAPSGVPSFVRNWRPSRVPFARGSSPKIPGLDFAQLLVDAHHGSTLAARRSPCEPAVNPTLTELHSPQGGSLAALTVDLRHAGLDGARGFV